MREREKENKTCFCKSIAGALSPVVVAAESFRFEKSVSFEAWKSEQRSPCVLALNLNIFNSSEFMQSEEHSEKDK